MAVFTVEQFVRDFLVERRLTRQEVDAVIKIARNDSSLCHVLWDVKVVEVPASLLLDLREVMRQKVIYWMDRYQPAHKARCMFTGES